MTPDVCDTLIELCNDEMASSQECIDEYKSRLKTDLYTQDIKDDIAYHTGRVKYYQRCIDEINGDDVLTEITDIYFKSHESK